VPTIPNLDSETTYLSSEEAIKKIKKLPHSKALYVTSFESGFGEYYDFIRRTSPIIAEPKPFEHFRGTSGAVTGYPLDSILSIINSSNVSQIVLTPVKRMPRWGDGSIHYSCSSCSRPCIEDEMALKDAKIYHKECLEIMDTD
jgi:hypothetical protein